MEDGGRQGKDIPYTLSTLQLQTWRETTGVSTTMTTSRDGTNGIMGWGSRNIYSNPPCLRVTITIQIDHHNTDGSQPALTSDTKATVIQLALDVNKHLNNERRVQN